MAGIRVRSRQLQGFAGLLAVVCAILVLSAPRTVCEVPESADAAVGTPDSASVEEERTPAPDAVGRAECEQGYSLAFSAYRVEPGAVRLDVTTSIPGIVEVMADISLAGQKGDDIWIGVDARVRLTDGRGSATYDVTELPAALYDVEVSFYPKWGQQDDVAKSVGLLSTMHARGQMNLAGSGESAKDAAFREEGQRWVMLNVEVGETWSPGFWTRKFGDWTEYRVTSGNPDVLKAYYFSSIDVTLIVNVFKGEIATWRLGKATS